MYVIAKVSIQNVFLILFQIGGGILSLYWLIGPKKVGSLWFLNEIMILQNIWKGIWVKRKWKPRALVSFLGHPWQQDGPYNRYLYPPHCGSEWGKSGKNQKNKIAPIFMNLNVEYLYNKNKFFSSGSQRLSNVSDKMYNWWTE